MNGKLYLNRTVYIKKVRETSPYDYNHKTVYLVLKMRKNDILQ